MAYSMVPGLDSSTVPQHIDIVSYGALALGSPLIVWFHVQK